MGTAARNSVCQDMGIRYNIEVPSLGTDPRGTSAHVHQNACAVMFRGVFWKLETTQLSLSRMDK